MRIAPLAQWIARWTSNPKVAGSSPAGGKALAAVATPSDRARLAQSVARGSHNPKVVSSILAPRTRFLFQERTLRSAGVKKAPEGFEPSTLRLLGVRSNQLSYGAAFGETVMDGQTAIAAGLEPATVGSEVQRSSIEPRDRSRKVVRVGFEPTPPKRLRPERSALDHSATSPLQCKRHPLWGSNPRPLG